MKHPFEGARLVLQNGNPLEDLRLDGGQLSLSSQTGEINASDRLDLANQISKLMEARASGKLVPQRMSALAKGAEYAQKVAASRELFAAARADNGKWAALGAGLASRIEESRARNGFIRNISLGNTLRQGEVARVPVTPWDSVAVVATSVTDVGYQVIRNKMYQAAEFEIIASLRSEALDIEQNTGDILEDLYEQGLDSLMVQEDRVWKRSADKAVGIVNPLEYITGKLSPENLANLTASVGEWNLPVSTAIISRDFWPDVVSNSEFHQFLDPVSKYDLVMNGQLATLVGLNLLTDAFRNPNQKVLNKGEIYVVANPEHHAAYTDRGGVRSTPTSGADQGNTSKGWMLNEFFSFVLANPRSIAKGQRI